MIDYRMEYLFSYRTKMHGHDVMGPCPGGFRFNGYILEGEVEGPRLKGRFRPNGGGDFVTLRPDGICLLDVRAVIETEDGALISLAEPGMDDFGEDGYERFLEGVSPPDPIRMHTQPRFTTAHADYLWLNRLFCVGIGDIYRQRSEKHVDVYAVH